MTQGQREVLETIRLLTIDGVSPTLAEIAGGLGFRSTSHVHAKIMALRRDGWLTVERGQWRGRQVCPTYEILRGKGASDRIDWRPR